jgi:predicted lipid-binding transport protein (Tim44 family)
MGIFDFARAGAGAGAGAVRQQMAPSPINYSNLAHERQRARPRAALGAIGTLLVLMGIGMGVLTIRFILVFAHTVLQ